MEFGLSLSLSLCFSLSLTRFSLSHSLLVSRIKIKKLAMIVVYRQRSGSQRFKPEKRQAGGAAGGAAANNGDSQKKQKRTDGWMERRWHVCGCVCDTSGIHRVWGRKPNPERGRLREPILWGWMDGRMRVDG